MNKKAEKLPRTKIKNFPENTKTATDKMIADIIDHTNQTAVNKSDEVDVMCCMLNDKDFKVAVYDRSKGYVGSRSPRDEAIGIATDTLSSVTGMSSNEAKALTENYQFTKKDATRYLHIAKDFYGTYLQSGRKAELTCDPRGESIVSLKFVEGKEKSIPDREGGTKKVKTTDSIKLIATNKR